MSVGIYFSGLYVKIYKIKSGFGQRGGDICFPLKTTSSSFGISPKCFVFIPSVPVRSSKAAALIFNNLSPCNSTI